MNVGRVATTSPLRRMTPPKVLQRRPVRDLIGITTGVLLAAWGLDAFLIPNKLAAGGVSGLATVIHHALRDQGVFLPVGVQMLLMNVVLLLIAVRLRGWRYGARTIYGLVALSVAVDLLAPITPHLASNDNLLAALYGGAVTGLGLGLVFKAGGNTGGTDIIAQLLTSRISLGVGQMILIVDALVMLTAAAVFGPELALYGAVAVFVGGAVIDLVLEGLPVEKAAFIVSAHSDRIAASILSELERGATALSGRGLYSGEARDVIFTVVSRRELDDLKKLVKAIDPQALLIISDVHEAIGEGFKEMSAVR